jgi:hypothetical protein
MPSACLALAPKECSQIESIPIQMSGGKTSSRSSASSNRALSGMLSSQRLGWGRGQGASD